jgi:hypothetical protein
MTKKEKTNGRHSSLELNVNAVSNEWCCSPEIHERYLKSILKFSPEVNEKNRIL